MIFNPLSSIPENMLILTSLNVTSRCRALFAIGSTVSFTLSGVTRVLTSMTAAIMKITTNPVIIAINLASPFMIILLE